MSSPIDLDTALKKPTLLDRRRELSSCYGRKIHDRALLHSNAGKIALSKCFQPEFYNWTTGAGKSERRRCSAEKDPSVAAIKPLRTGASKSARFHDKMGDIVDPAFRF